MNAQVQIGAAPQLLETFRALDDITRHKVLQLFIREFRYAEDEADVFLAEAASELTETEAQHDNLYPIGMLNMEASRFHRIDLERDVLRAERIAAGRLAMMTAHTEPMPNTATAWGALR